MFSTTAPIAIRSRVFGLGVLCFPWSIGTSVAQGQSTPQQITRSVRPSADPRAELLRVGVARFGPDAWLYVAEDAHRDIRIFDEAGRFRGNVGHMGSGPGEFRRIMDFGWVGDTLWVTDGNLRRITLFDAARKLVRAFRWDVGGVPTQHVGDVMTAGKRVVQPHSGTLASASAAPLLSVTRDGRVLDTLAQLMYGPVQADIRIGKNRLLLRRPFPDYALWDVDRTGRWLAVVERSAAPSPARTSVSVVLHDLQRGTRQLMNIAYSPVRLTKAQQDSALTIYPPTLSRDELRATFHFPAFVPPVAAVVVSDDGGVWLERSGEAPGTWVRIGTSGTVTHVARVPAPYRVVDASGGSLLAVVALPDDSQAAAIVIEVYR